MMNVQLVSMTAIQVLLALVIHTVLLLASVMAATPEMDLLALMTLTTVNLTLSASTPMAPLLVRPIL